MLGIEAAALWPVFECLVTTEWQDTANLAHVLVAKEPPFGGVVCCVFLLDLACLGPKEAFVTQFRTRGEYETEFRALMMSRYPMNPIEYALAAKVISEALRYARTLGFEMPPRVSKALAALGPLDVAATCQHQIPLGGKDGIPSYIAGPDDDVDHIMATLTRTSGKGNFHFTIPPNPLPRDFFD
ncbi:MAG: hypothetical protein NT154_06480 [Verrucomicrobia bacterium]|nr:hypothetical protein [Verrucomicrobiota bacterium]